MSFLHSVKISLTPLSPIHIGCGEDYEPTNYVIKNKILYGFDPSSVKLLAREFSKLNLVSRSSRISDWAKYFKENEDTFIPYSRSACVCCPKAEEIYETMTTKGFDRNRGNIERTVYSRLPERDIPYIPGSSIKGAFATALMNEFKANGKNRYSKKEYGSRRDLTKLIKDIFEIDTSISPNFGRGISELNLTPMRFLKISDCLPDNNVFGLTEISAANRVFKHDGDKGKQEIPDVLESLTFCNYRPYNGIITQQDIPESIAKNIKSPDFDIKAAVKAVHKFSLDEFDKNKECWSEWSGSRDWIIGISKLLQRLDSQIKEGKACLIRLGKNQGAGGFTLTDNSAVWNLKTKQFMDEATTVWQCKVRGQSLPFGWALLEVDPQEDNIALKEWVESQTNPSAAIQNDRKLLIAKRAEREQKILEEKKRLEAEKEAAEKERLQNLPENERLLGAYHQDE